MTPKYIEERCPQCDRSIRTIVNGDWLRERREAAGLTLQQFANVLGVSKCYLSEVERNEKRATPRILDVYEGLPRSVSLGLRVNASVPGERPRCAAR